MRSWIALWKTLCRRNLKWLTIIGIFLVFLLLVIHNQNDIYNQQIFKTFPLRIRQQFPFSLEEISQDSNLQGVEFVTNPNPSGSNSKPVVTIVLVVCGQKRKVRTNALTLIKSAIFFSRDVQLSIILYKDGETDKDQQETIYMQLVKLKKSAMAIGVTFHFEIRESSFPESDKVDWRNMFRACTTQRLFLPTLLPDQDAVMYLDADIVFTSNVKDLWDLFYRMDDVQLMGMVANNEPPSQGYYGPHLKIPFYGPRGLNAGVALMNLTRMRSVQFEDAMSSIVTEYPKKLPKADQDLINIYFARNPEFMFDVPCRFNFRLCHCVCSFKGTGACNCASAEKEDEGGISLAHGNMKGFQHFPFKTLQDHLDEYDLELGNSTLLYEKILRDWGGPEDEKDNRCIQEEMKENLLQRFKSYLPGPTVIAAS